MNSNLQCDDLGVPKEGRRGGAKIAFHSRPIKFGFSIKSKRLNLILDLYEHFFEFGSFIFQRKSRRMGTSD